MCCVPAQYHDVQKKDAGFCRCSVPLVGSWFSIFCIVFGQLFFFFFLNCYFNVKFWRKWLAKSTVTFKLKISLDIRMHELTYSVDWGSFKWLTVCHMYRHVAGADTTTCFQVFHSLWNPLTEEERGYHLSMSQLSGILYLPSTQQYLEWISLCPLSLCY